MAGNLGTKELYEQPYETSFNAYEDLKRPTFKAETPKEKPPKESHSRGIMYCIGAISLISLGVSITAIALLFTYQGSETTSKDTQSIPDQIFPDSTSTSVPVGAPGPQGPSGPTGPQGPPGSAANTGAVYVRWGRTVCPSNATLVYSGLAAGSWFQQGGSGANRLCLPETPEYDEYRAGQQNPRALIYSSEYQIEDFPPLLSKHDHDAPCVVCRASNRGSLWMIPAMMNCPTGWTREYYGYLMSEYHGHTRSEFICVDRSPEVIAGTSEDRNGALLYPTEVRCTGAGSLPCAPYIDGAELTCVVCTK